MYSQTSADYRIPRHCEGLVAIKGIQILGFYRLNSQSTVFVYLNVRDFQRGQLRYAKCGKKIRGICGEAVIPQVRLLSCLTHRLRKISWLCYSVLFVCPRLLAFVHR